MSGGAEVDEAPVRLENIVADIEGDGYKRLLIGQAVSLTYETPGFLQDGYPHRAVSVQPR